MSYTLDRFAAESHRILAADSGLEGREQVRALSLCGECRRWSSGRDDSHLTAHQFGCQLW